MADYSTKLGESLSKIKTQLLGRDGLPVNLAAATEVQFYARHESGEINEIDGLACTILSPSEGVVRLPGVAPGSIGYYEGWFKIMWSGSDPDYVPSRGYFSGEVEETWE